MLFQNDHRFVINYHTPLELSGAMPFGMFLIYQSDAAAIADETTVAL